jgi:hypothetical protein
MCQLLPGDFLHVDGYTASSELRSRCAITSAVVGSLKAACNGYSCAATLCTYAGVATTVDTDALINAVRVHYRHRVLSVQQDDSAAQTADLKLCASNSNNTTGVMRVYDARSQTPQSTCAKSYCLVFVSVVRCMQAACV